MMARGMWRWAPPGLCLVSMLLLTACGASQAGAPSTSTEVAATSVPSPIPTPTPTIDELFPSRSVWHFENERGYTYDMTIALGEPTRISESGTLIHPMDDGFAVGSACTVDPKLDVVIPAYWSAEVTTVGFDTPVSMRALFTDVGGAGTSDGEYHGQGPAPFDGDDRVLVAQNFSGGDECRAFSSTNIFGYGGSNGFCVQWNDPVSEGSVRTALFFIVVKSYFTPASPQGDAALLDWIVLRPLLAGDLDDPAMVYRDADGANLGIYSEKGITLSGKVVDPSIPPPTETQAASDDSFAVGDNVIVGAAGRLVVRTAPSLSSDTLPERLSSGEMVTIVAGPEQGDDRTWYQVETSDGTKGWIISKYVSSED
jgi:hypothetical protein